MFKIKELKNKQNMLLDALRSFTEIKANINKLLYKVENLYQSNNDGFIGNEDYKNFSLENFKTNMELSIEINKEVREHMGLFLQLIMFDEYEDLLKGLNNFKFNEIAYDLSELVNCTIERTYRQISNNSTEYKTIVDGDYIFLKSLKKGLNAYINTLSEIIGYVKILPDESENTK